MAKKCGATVKDVFWTLGEYDVVAIVEAPDDISMTALGLSSGALGNIRTQTLRAFTQADMKTIPWQDGLGLDGETGTTCRSRSTTKFGMVMSLISRPPKALASDVSPALLARAGEVIE